MVRVVGAARGVSRVFVAAKSSSRKRLSRRAHGRFALSKRLRAARSDLGSYARCGETGGRRLVPYTQADGKATGFF